MKILSINLGNFGSTGKIIDGIFEVAKNEGFDCIKSYPDNSNNISKQKDDIIICSDLYRRINQRFAYYSGYVGCFSFFATIRLLRKIKRISPDIIHLHNIHHSFINHGLLFRFIKKNNIKVIWTLHDCWPFTGQCAHFVITECQKWKTGCCYCKQIDKYPSTKFDRTQIMWKKKRKWFSGINDMLIVTPSVWLSELVKQSFLNNYSVKVINNGIDLNVFFPQKSLFRDKYNVPNSKIILLGVSFEWDYRKGLDVFLDLYKLLDSRFVIVLVGTTNNVDALLPEGIISIHRTKNQKELAEIYSAADIFINPTREENYPTVNMEAIACGTPVITFNTGGSPEIINERTGIVTETNTVDSMLKAIYQMSSRIGKDTTTECLKHSLSFDQNNRFNEYVNLYKEMCSNHSVI